MTTPATPQTEGNPRLRSASFSSDGKWRSFPNVPNLLQFVSTGQYYGRLKIRGKVIRRSLKTDVWTTAKLRLLDFLKDQREQVPKTESPTFSECVARFKTRLSEDVSMKPSSREYRGICIRKIELTWPELWNERIVDISPDQCRSWAANLRKGIAAQYYNNVIDTLRLVIEEGITTPEGTSQPSMLNPAKALPRARVLPKKLNLPESTQFKEMVASIRRRSGGWGHKAGDLVEFLAYSGLRLYTEAQWVKWEDVDWKRSEIVVHGDPETRTKNWELRRIPILPDMKLLLEAMAADRNPAPTGPILEVSRCPEALKRVCNECGIPRITHHDLRHLFATRCIESGVDIPTVARWLGHKDGGALAMKTYGHLRNEHSQEMARRVKF